MNLVVTSGADGCWLDWGQGRRRCAIGPGGIAIKHGEGDGITPRGTWPVREIFYRPDRVKEFNVELPLWKIAPDDGWCDAPDDDSYNRLVKLPYAASAETMWRDDSLYDIVAVLGFNDDPVRRGAGSAIFLHQARDDYSATHGCVALARDDLVEALQQLQQGDKVVIK